MSSEDGAPVAGGFEGWPDDLSEFRLLDPCCGSGHFLVAAFLMLVPMRMALENLDAAEAADAVLRDNLHGLELDQRCVAIAAFALAMEAWRYPDAGDHRPLPRFNLAWCGQPVGGKREQWTALFGGDSRIENGMRVLYDTFQDAPLLGSLLDPTSVSEDMLTAGFGELQPSLKRVLSKHAGEEEWEETAIAALGLTEATRLMSRQYHLVITNVPYLARGKQKERLQSFAERRSFVWHIWDGRRRDGFHALVNYHKLAEGTPWRQERCWRPPRRAEHPLEKGPRQGTDARQGSVPLVLG